MFLGRKNQYCENDYTTKRNLQIQCDPCQITNGIFHRTRTKNFTIHMETQKTLKRQSILRKKNGTGGSKLPDFRYYYKATVHQDSVVLAQKQKYRPMEQYRKPRNKSMHLRVLIFGKGGKNIQWDKDSLFNKWCWENWTATSKRMKLEHFLTSYTNINSKWIKDLNVRPETKTLRGIHRQNTRHKSKQDPLLLTS